MENSFQIIAKTYKGLEEVLAKELIDLGADKIEMSTRAISFWGDKTLLYKANLYARTATRFLVPIKHFTAQNADEIYEQVKNIDWSEFIDVNNTFAIDSTVFSETFTHSKFVAYRVKDAICDQFMEKFNKRPSVSLTNPDFMLNIHVSETQCTLSIDSSGESLHKRGYRVDQNEAPISEALAAGMLLLAGWDGSCDFIDPMCGSGTLLIEAALIALNIPPGIFRKSFAFEKWKNFDKDLFDELYNDDSYEREFTHKIYGSDLSSVATKIAEKNIKSAGLMKYISLQTKDIAELQIPKSKMLMVTNPPYGERIKVEQIEMLYKQFGTLLKKQFVGNQAWMITSSEEGMRAIGLRPSQKISLINGDLDCIFANYEVFEGKRNDFVKKKVASGEYQHEKEQKEHRNNKPKLKYKSFSNEKPKRKKSTRENDRKHGGKRFYSNNPEDRNYGGPKISKRIEDLKKQIGKTNTEE